jgi:hypothetical protein
MKKPISASALSLLGLLLSAQASAETLNNSNANLVNELEASGYVQINRSTGEITLKGSVLDVLKAAGVASDVKHSVVADGGCHETGGDCLGSDPRSAKV